MAEREGPAEAPRGPSRMQQGPRDMVLSILPLVLIVLAVAGVAGMCSFSPGGPTVDPDSAPRIDAGQRLEQAARTVPFPVREPALAPGWRATSSTVSRVGTGADAPRAVRVGWLTPGGRYLRLSQSTAAEAALVEFETEQQAAPLGAVQAGDRAWVRYPGIRSEQAWVTDLGDTRLLITGSAGPADFRTLATATLRAPVLPG